MLRKICRHPQVDVLHAYACVMAWGGQRGNNPGLVYNAKANRVWLKDRLERVRAGGHTCNKAYDLLCDRHVAGLGPAFLTKILYFFSPKEDKYIMDQWTARSVNLLTGQPIVHLDNSNWVTRINTGKNYSTFCTAVDRLSDQLGVPGPEVEYRLYASGTWREYVRRMG